MGVFFSARGKLDRRTFWAGSLLLAALWGALQLLETAGQTLALLLVIPQVCLFSKRLHDLGKSGWFTGVPCGLALLGGLVLALTRQSSVAPSDLSFGGALAAAGCWLVGVLFFVRVGLAEPDMDPKAYGAPPTTASDADSRQAA